MVQMSKGIPGLRGRKYPVGKYCTLEDKTTYITIKLRQVLSFGGTIQARQLETTVPPVPSFGLQDSLILHDGG